MICFSSGKYIAEILFDVVPMETSHLLLGRPWQYDRDVVYNVSQTNFHLWHKGKKVTLKPLSPSEFYEDQIKMSEKREQERKEEKIKSEKKKKCERREKKEKSGDKKKEWNRKKRWKLREKNTKLVHERKRGKESDAS